ncbi:sperm-associated antigen 8 [Tyto alba]|uniref:sperm-associated antigen 8 n=1 Tax=Tyto alba TaxID=56313 RepID=UPI001C67C1D3|nr:sperm-associated antigen 8 [Tyto alba]
MSSCPGSPQELPRRGGTATAATEMPQEPWGNAEEPRETLSAAAEPPAEGGKGPCGVERPPGPGKRGACPSEVPPIVVPALAASLQTPAERPSPVVPRGSCLTGNWQEEGSAGPCWRPRSTRNSGEPAPLRVTHPRGGALEGGRPAGLDGGDPRAEGCGPCSARRSELLEGLCPPQTPTGSVSARQRDGPAGGCRLSPAPPTQPHNYCTEQPRSFWLGQARSLPGVTGIRSGDSPFRRNGAFSTPIAESLEQPLPRVPLSSRLRPQKQ